MPVEIPDADGALTGKSLKQAMELLPEEVDVCVPIPTMPLESPIKKRVHKSNLVVKGMEKEEIGLKADAQREKERPVPQMAATMVYTKTQLQDAKRKLQSPREVSNDSGAAPECQQQRALKAKDVAAEQLGGCLCKPRGPCRT